MRADDEDETCDDEDHAEKRSKEFRVGVEQVAAIARCSASHGKNERDRYIDSGKLEPGDKYLLRKKVQNNEGDERKHRKKIQKLLKIIKWITNEIARIIEFITGIIKNR